MFKFTRDSKNNLILVEQNNDVFILSEDVNNNLFKLFFGNDKINKFDTTVSEFLDNSFQMFDFFRDYTPLFASKAGMHKYLKRNVPSFYNILEEYTEDVYYEDSAGRIAAHEIKAEFEDNKIIVKKDEKIDEGDIKNMPPEAERILVYKKGIAPNTKISNDLLLDLYNELKKIKIKI